MPRDAAPIPSLGFTDRYRRGDLDGLFELPPGDLGAALAVERHADRAALAAAMRSHAERWGAPEAVHDMLERLEQPGSIVVATGQQTGLLLGPTYSLSKAIGAIQLARRIDTPDRPAVPVFWLASQDHDGAEIDHAYLLDGEERLHRAKVTLPADMPAGRVPMHESMMAAVTETFDAMRPQPPCRAPVEALLRDTAARARGYADWFAGIMYRLLGSQGLLLFDPMDPAAAPLLRAPLERELARPEAGPATINEAARRLRALGLEPQLGRAADATNLFLEVDGAAGPRRVLLRYDGKDFRAEGERLSVADVRERLRQDPASLTPAAGLRPIVQDSVFPTAVNVLGPGELRYVAQLRGVYRLHDLPMPLAWPRPSATILEPPVARMLGRYDLDALAFQRDPAGCLERVILERSGHGTRFRQAADELERLFATLLTEVDGIDPTLQGTVQRGRRHLDLTLERLRGKTARALAQHDAITRGQFDRLGDHLLPLHQPAERVLSPFSHMLKFGIRPVLDLMLGLEAEGDQVLAI